MEHMHFDDPALQVALALAAGVIAQSAARHLRVPGIVVLLGAGVCLGPDVLNLIRPRLLGETMHTLVGFAVAVILFEGGMHLNFRGLQRQARSIRQLVTAGALVTLFGGTIAAHLVLGWGWVPGLTGGLVASLLGLRRASNNGFVIIGANHLARALARVLTDAGQEVVLLESNPSACSEAQREGYRVLYGVGLNESTLARAELESRAGCIALTPNEAVNMLFARTALKDFKVRNVWVTLRRGHTNVTPEMVQQAGARVLFGEPRLIDLWTLRLERGLARVERWQRTAESESDDVEIQEMRAMHKAMLPLAVLHGRRIAPIDATTTFKKDDALYIVLFDERREAGVDWLRSKGWEHVDVVRLKPAPEPSPAAV